MVKLALVFIFKMYFKPLGIERIATNDIGVIVRLLNKRTMDLLDEFVATKQSKFSRNGEHMILNCKIHTEKLTVIKML